VCLPTPTRKGKSCKQTCCGPCAVMPSGSWWA
jgi:hypothetical protein